MKKYSISLLFILFFTGIYVHVSIAQNALYMPLEFKQAYENGTRNHNGNPGENYWQNRADYQIEAAIATEKSLLSGEETITYYNNSPDTLHMLVFQLFQDMYKKGNVRKRHIHPSDVTEGTTIQGLAIGKQQIDLNNTKRVSRQNGLLKVKLNAPILPGASAQVSIAWTYHIPEKTFIRTARFDSAAFFVAYWFPRIAVYDDIFGWDHYGYDGLHEFNNNHGNFTVKINVPDDYLVWSSGELQNPTDVYAKDILQKLAALKTSSKPTRIVSGSALIEQKGKGTKEWVFAAENTMDFAFGLSNHHNWDAMRFTIGDGTEKQVNSVYIPESEPSFKIMTEFLTACIQYFSDEIPGVNYPYAQYTAFEGLNKGWHTAIEFPAISNNSYKERDTVNFSIFAHELAHNYFPFHVNINETQFSWFEEGLTVYFELDIMRSVVKKEKFDVYKSKHPLDIYSGRFNDVPPFIPSTLYENEMVLQTAYHRPAYAYLALEDMLGQEQFKRCLKEFIVRWEGKRPIPHDMFNTFNEVAGQDLNWFWKPWFFEFAYPDLAIDHVQNNMITIKRTGKLPIPVHVKITYTDGSFETIEKTAEIWKNGNDLVEITADSSKTIQEIRLSDKHEIPDIDRTNNVYIAEN